jgi:toxin YoeB
VKLVFHEQAWDDYLYWQATDPKLLKRLIELIGDAARSPFSGFGKPEPLRGPLSGWWLRRLTDEHRLDYRAEGDRLLVAQCRYHY